MPAELVLPQGKIVRTAVGGTDALKRILVELKRYAFTGYLKTTMGGSGGASSGCVVIVEGVPELALYASGQKVTEGKVALKSVWEDSYSEKCSIEIHAKIEVEPIRAAYPQAQLDPARRPIGSDTSASESDAEAMVRSLGERAGVGASRDSPIAEATGQPSMREGGTNLIRQYSFDTFVVGPSNRFAHAASVAVAASPHTAYNPLFITSGPGLGKTHLLNAIGNAVLAADPSARVVYATAEGFSNEFKEAQASRRLPEFRQKYRMLDVALLDDAHFLSGKGDVQEELFHTFNDLYNANKQIVLTSDRPPKDIPDLEDRLVSRFESGLVADIQPPEYETRVAILRRRARDAGASVDEEVIAFVGHQMENNIRELGGALNRVVAFSQLMKQPVSLALAKEVLGEPVRPQTATERRDVVRREMDLRGGHAYLVQEDRPETVFALLTAALASGGRGMIVTRQNPKRVRELYRVDDCRILWLTERESAEVETIPPSLERLIHAIEEFMGAADRGAVLIDGVEYLVSSNNFDSVLKFLRRLIDHISETQFALLVSASTKAMREHEIKNLEREMEAVAP